VDLGFCRGCNVDSECGGATPRCDVQSGACVPCMPQHDNCDRGKYCQESQGVFSCASGCKDDTECGGGADAGSSMACCNHACVDTSSTPLHCGGCGRVCGQGVSCCSGACVNLANNVFDCGSCGNVCSLPHATPNCANSMCGIDACAPGWTNCDQIPADGCEVHSDVDINNCGTCKNSCPPVANGLQGCIGGVCGIGACNNGFADCDMSAMNGCEVNLNTDSMNCGKCGTVCAMGKSCVQAVCM
jgi:hypothetical protein